MRRREFIKKGAISLSTLGATGCSSDKPQQIKHKEKLTKSWIIINEHDNVLVALKDISKGQALKINDTILTLRDTVNLGHKIAMRTINKGEDVVKYGFPIGNALKDIQPGEHVHIHNVKTNLSGLDTYSFRQNLKPLSIEKRNLTFKGYKREDGSVGIRNGIWIVPTVGCVNGIADKIIERFKKEVQPHEIDSCNVFKHQFGCAQIGEDFVNTRTILGDIVKHPNAGGVLVLGLGCEYNQVDKFRESLDIYNEKRVKFLIAQHVPDEIKEGVKFLKELYENAKNDVREDVALSEMKIGLECGGSDGLSGITANPLVGAFSDFLVAQGGTTVLSEVPEMFGAETILMERALNEQIFDKIVHLINNYKNYFIQNNQPIYENPAPGNKEGGLTTLEEKSLGCIQKGGKATVVDVLDYGERIKENGLNLLCTPGYDLDSTTALAATGCQMVLFTTGRGTPFGTFVPTVKISTNTHLYEQKPHWIDFNSGILVEDKDIEELLEMFIDYIIAIANGERVNNEKNNFMEIALFKTGVTM